MKNEVKTMRVQSLVMAIAIAAIFPIAASAQGFNNININLNDVMVGQRMQDMSRQLDSANASGFIGRKHHKHMKNKKDHHMAVLMQDANSQNPIIDMHQSVDAQAPVSAVDNHVAP
jgi:hypothetical protein